jgi:hypothetical protein
MQQPNLMKLLKRLKLQNITKKNLQQRNELIEHVMNIIDDTSIRNKTKRIYKLTLDNVKVHTLISNYNIKWLRNIQHINQ